MPANRGQSARTAPLDDPELTGLFPNQNPHPVMRMKDGRLVYANPASQAVLDAIGIGLGDPVPDDLRASIETACISGVPIELPGEGRTYELRAVDVADYGFTNIYGTDVTAAKALNKYPDQNPNPVLRISRDGILEYANPASELVCRGLGLVRGERVPDGLLARIRTMAADAEPAAMEVESDGRVFSVLVVAVFEFGSINLYGTDITASRQVERALAENERLLLNILPPSIATRLRNGEAVIADRIEAMTVLFADVVDFTAWASTAEATAVVSVLNEVFSRFDRLVDRHGLEKIKTIGDAYMVAGGLDEATRGDVAAVAGMALEMLDALETYRRDGGYDLHVRIGLHVGPTVAGVIGLRKFSYDVWGDTVNVASRLEAAGLPDRIQVTQETARLLAGRFAFEPRGPIALKGRGSIETCFLVGRV
ncbi:MAG TPA: adenylate/guanylate cyclase domain-containing protein [Candidatus Limnocylindrales bacterium]|nr:adenylate/guanylate cyclase domain-containing protein [Candidatus Limnocylindrales bacterium]